jgi:hypothetical protein
MEETHKNKWLTVSYIALIIIFFIGFIYAAFVGSKDAVNRRMEDTTAVRPQSRTEDVDIILSLGREQIVGRNKLVYHGLKKGRIHIAVYITDLDPEVAYHHTATIEDARQGIRLGGQPFVLISASKSTVRLKRNQ